MHIDHQGSALSDYIFFQPKGNQVFFTRCHDYLKQRHERPKSYAEKMLCSGPVESALAPFYLCWHLGLLPVKDGHADNDAPVFYDIPSSGFDRIPEDSAIFIEIMVDLLDNSKVSREAVTMMIEFHDFLAVRDPAQALRFMTEIVEDYVSRHDHIKDLVSKRGEFESLPASEGFDQTLRQALVNTGWLEKGIATLPPPALSQAYRRLKWPEMAKRAKETDLEHVLSDDLGL
jgi:hypothetical protein